MHRYVRVICPVCGEITDYKEPGANSRGCEHFERVIETDEGKVAVFFHHYGEEVPVILDSVADQCAILACPICEEEVNACIHGPAKQYVVRSKCPHFRAINRKGDQLCVLFQDGVREELLCL